VPENRAKIAAALADAEGAEPVPDDIEAIRQRLADYEERCRSLDMIDSASYAWCRLIPPYTERCLAHHENSPCQTCAAYRRAVR
jgi:hypothetical protein